MERADPQSLSAGPPVFQFIGSEAALCSNGYSLGAVAIPGSSDPLVLYRDPARARSGGSKERCPYFASEGGFTAGPLLFPGSPGTLDESCWRTARLWSLMSEPVVSPEGFTAGPLLLPGLPGIPAPEFCPLGTVAWPPPEGAVVCAEAGSATIASAVAPISNLNMENSLLV
jgi:hypothetical protein